MKLLEVYNIETRTIWRTLMQNQTRMKRGVAFSYRGKLYTVVRKSKDTLYIRPGASTHALLEAVLAK